MTSFASQIEAWVRSAEQRLGVLFRGSVQAVADEARLPQAAGGNMPVRSGRLQRSLEASLEAMPSVSVGQEEFVERSAEIAATIAEAELGDTIFLGFQAEHARPVEHRAGFVRLTAQRWPAIVQEQGLGARPFDFAQGRHSSGASSLASADDRATGVARARR